MKVDVHAHCYPKAYAEELAKHGKGRVGGLNSPLPVWSESFVLEHMDKLGVTVQVLALSAPNVYFEDDQLSLALAQITNDFISDVCRRYPGRFLGVASVPLGNLDLAVSELHRAIDTLGMVGVVLGTTINRSSVAEDRFLPFLTELNRRKIPALLHPMNPIGHELFTAEDQYLEIGPAVYYPTETTRVMAQLTFKGALQELDELTFVLPHSGGAVPFLIPRWDTMYHSRMRSKAPHPFKKLSQPPSYYLKKHYYDTALSYYPVSLRCTIGFAGIDHVVFGTDYPYTRSYTAGDTIEKINDCGLLEEELEKIYYRTAAKLFPGITGPRDT